MTQSEANREVKRLASAALQGLTDSGWPFAMVCDKDNEWTEADEARIAKALDNLIQKLFEQGNKITKE